MAKPDDRASYYADAASWDVEINRKHRKEGGLWRNLFFVSLLFIGGLIAAIALMLPLKQTQVYAISVDKETGRTTASQVVQTGPLAQDEAVLKSLIGSYVIQRETFDVYDGQERYNSVFAMSSGQARDSYVQLYSADNPKNPLYVHGEQTRMQVEIFAVSLLNPSTASVRYFKTITAQGGASAKAEFSAIVGFDFQQRAKGLEAIIANPLGFVVTSYRADEVFKGASR